MDTRKTNLLSYTSTNENLKAIVTGLNIQSEDTILAIGGSGDQAFALLEFAKKVEVADHNPAQIDYIKKRAEALSQRSIDKFLAGHEESEYDEYYIPQYFLHPDERIEKIRAKLNQLKILPKRNIFGIATENDYNKLYLSNALGHSTFSSKEEFLHIFLRIVNKMPPNGLIYAIGSPLIKDETIPRTKLESISRLRLDRELSYKANNLEDVWKPQVWRVVK